MKGRARAGLWHVRCWSLNSGPHGGESGTFPHCTTSWATHPFFWGHNSVIFSKYIQLLSRHSKPVLEHFYHFQKFPLGCLHLIFLPCLTTGSWACRLAFPGISCKQNLCIWLVALCIMSVGPRIHLYSGGLGGLSISCSFFLLASVCCVATPHFTGQLMGIRIVSCVLSIMLLEHSRTTFVMALLWTFICWNRILGSST